MTPIAICNLCAARQKVCSGPCACEADEEKGDVLFHIRNAIRGTPTCPLGRHNNSDPIVMTPVEAVRFIPRNVWPAHAADLANFSAGEIGLGSVCRRIIDDANDFCAMSTVARFLAKEYGIKSFITSAATYALKILVGGVEYDCSGCQLRQAESDTKYPLNRAQTCPIA